MGESRAQSVLNFWPLVVALVCLVVAVPAHAGEAHEGNMQIREELPPVEMEIASPDNSEEAISDSGGFVGNLPAAKKKPDYDLRNLKPEDYPLEFLIPFMKTSQVFKKKVMAKDAPSLTSRMDHEVPRKPKPLPRKWTALPPEPERAVRTIASSPVENSESAAEEIKSEIAGHELVSARPQSKPTRQLIDSFKASQ